MENLIWKIDNQNLNGGYWECVHCGAIYSRPQNWIPNIGRCTKCKKEWY